MYPNENFTEIYFPDLGISAGRGGSDEVGNNQLWGVSDHPEGDGKTQNEEKTLLQHFRRLKDAGKIRGLMAYSIVTEDNKALYYPIYTFNHPLPFTDSMHRYSDSSISNLLGSIRDEQIKDS